MSKSITSLAVPLTALGCLASPSSAGTPLYTVTELAAPEGVPCEAFGVSPGGTVAGRMGGRAVLWNENGALDLGDPDEAGFALRARAVNDAGQVACVGEGNPQTYQSFSWESGEWTLLGALPDLPDTIVEDIDAAGRIVGRSLVVGPGAPDRAFIWDDGVFTELGTLGGSTVAFGLNDIGQIVGWSIADLPGGERQLRGYMWDAGVMVRLDPLDGDVATQAIDVNDAGAIVGSSWHYTSQFLTTDQATLWREDGEEIIDLGRVPAAPGSCSSAPFWSKSIARAINGRGQIVGEAMCIGSGAPKAAFLWEDGVMHNLNDLVPPGSGLRLRSARDINDAGVIVGYALDEVDDLRAFRLTPVVMCPADTDGDGAVGLGDLLAVLSAWGSCPGCPEDIDGDGVVSLPDLLAVLAAWGPCA